MDKKQGTKNKKHNKYTLLIDYKEFWEEVQRVILNAQRSVCLQFMTFEGDFTGLKFSNLLIKKALQGLDIKVLIDDYTTMVLSTKITLFPFSKLRRPRIRRAIKQEKQSTKQMIERMKRCGITVRWTNPAGRWHKNLFIRNHKKAIVVDEQIAFVGGMNISDHNSSWHDFMVKIEGPLVEEIINDFRKTWYNLRLTTSTIERDPAEDLEQRDIDLVVSSSLLSSRLEQQIIRRIRWAKKEIFVESPYLGGRVFKEIFQASRRGVKVILVIPKDNNNFLCKYLYRYYRRILGPHAEFYQYSHQTKMTHAKAMVIDEEWVIFGSSNFDPMGLLLYDELNIISQSKGLVDDFRQRLVNEDVKHSQELTIGEVNWADFLLGKFFFWFSKRFLGAYHRSALKNSSKALRVYPG